MKVWATLEARAAGETTLKVADAQGERDELAIVVAEPARIGLRATSLSAFAFVLPDPMLSATAGESLLVLPELYDDSNTLLVGAAELDWRVDEHRGGSRAHHTGQ